MNEREADQAIALEPSWVASLRQDWLAMMECAVFADVSSSRIGAGAKLRKRALEAGERVRSLCADRAWIPRPRERVKNALASAMLLRESLAELERAAAAIDRGRDRGQLLERIDALKRRTCAPLASLEERCAVLLDRSIAATPPD